MCVTLFSVCVCVHTQVPRCQTVIEKVWVYWGSPSIRSQRQEMAEGKNNNFKSGPRTVCGEGRTHWLPSLWNNTEVPHCVQIGNQWRPSTAISSGDGREFPVGWVQEPKDLEQEWVRPAVSGKWDSTFVTLGKQFCFTSYLLSQMALTLCFSERDGKWELHSHFLLLLLLKIQWKTLRSEKPW